MAPEIKDSGARREFGTGAVRDMSEGKGRNDLLHPGVMLHIMSTIPPIEKLQTPFSNTYQCKKALFDYFVTENQQLSMQSLVDAYMYACALLMGEGDVTLEAGTMPTSFTVFVEGTMALAKHYEKGAKKYGDHNWSKGIPSVSFYDSAHRHMDKYILGLTDEPHVEACMFNIVGLLYNIMFRPELEFKIYEGGKRKPDPEAVP
jgi:hypothetical protein